MKPQAAFVEIEQRLCEQLEARHAGLAVDRALASALREWSQAAWDGAAAHGPRAWPDGEVERGLTLARNPVFICGPARSGTSLLRALLDGHPELAVIPSESRFLTSLERPLLAQREDRQVAFLARFWLERLADAPPFFLLGRSTEHHSPSVAFARDFAAWWRVGERHREARTTSWPLACLALACAQTLAGGRLPREARMWVEKTPGSERSLSRIWNDFPAAKVIMIVRRPEDVLGSIKRMPARRWSRRKALAHVLGQMAPSYRIAARSERLPASRFELVRYEELTTEPEQVMRRLARFLGIVPSASLLHPTAAGRPAFDNSSFGRESGDIREGLGPFEKTLLAWAVARHAASLGYLPGEPSGPARRIGGMEAERASPAAELQRA